MLRVFARMTCALLLFGAGLGPAVAVDLDTFLTRDSIAEVQLSPSGEYIAASLPQEDRTALVVIRLADKVRTNIFMPPSKNHVVDFDWVSDDRLLLSLGEKIGALEQPYMTGELYSLSASGGQGQLLVGYRTEDERRGSRIQGRQPEWVRARLINPLHADPRHVLVQITQMGESSEFPHAARMDVRSGKRQLVARSPLRRASFTADAQGNVRFVYGSNDDNVQKLYHRAVGQDQWQLVHDQASNGDRQRALGLNHDGTVAYLEVSAGNGDTRVEAWHVADGRRQVLLQRSLAAPVSVIYDLPHWVPIGVRYDVPTAESVYFDAQSESARRHQRLSAALDGQVQVTSATADAGTLLVRSRSDRNPGDYYLYDEATRNAAYLMSRAEKVDPEAMRPTKVEMVRMRDGVEIQLLVTTPAAHAPGKPQPMVVLPHGGPYGIHDTWYFEAERQLLAAAGYVVLQPNFRGSGGRGMAFQWLGARQWGQSMQDDVTDATRWAIAQGYADAQRICIYGASYGAYAALMGAVREPDLYRCAAGMVGVYDLPRLHSERVRGARWAGNWSEDWVGTDAAMLAANSPNRHADRIRVPVLLSSGGQDTTATPQHTTLMEQALRKAGVPVQHLYYPTEGHGYYKPENQYSYYRGLLDFLADHLGGERAQP